MFQYQFLWIGNHEWIEHLLSQISKKPTRDLGWIDHEWKQPRSRILNLLMVLRLMDMSFLPCWRHSRGKLTLFRIEFGLWLKRFKNDFKNTLIEEVVTGDYTLY